MAVADKITPVKGLHIHINNPTMQTDADVERLMERIVERLRRNGVMAKYEP